MAGFESFFGLDQMDGSMTPEAVEAFREQMKRNASQIAAIKKDEQKQKQKEDKLVAVLLKFIKSGRDNSLVTLIASLLAENVPASLIVGVLSLNYPELQREIAINLSVSLIAPEREAESAENRLVSQDSLGFVNLSILPLQVKIALDLWFQALQEGMDAYPDKILKTVIDPLSTVELQPKISIVQLSALILRDFLAKKAAGSETDRLREFMFNVFRQMLARVAHTFQNRPRLQSGD